MTRSVLLVLTINCVLGALSSYSFAAPITEHRIPLSTPSSAMKLDLVCRNDSVAGLYLNHDQSTTINSVALVTLAPFMNQIYYAKFYERFEVRPYYIRIPLASDTFILDRETKKGSLILPSVLYTKLDPFHFLAIQETAKFFTNVIQILLTKFVIVSTSSGTKTIEISLDAFNNQELRQCLDQTDFQSMANAVGARTPTSQDEFHLQDKNRPWIPTFSRICFAMGHFNRIAQDLPQSLRSVFSQYFPADCQPRMNFNQTSKWTDMKPTLLAVREFNYEAIKSYAVSTDIPTDGYVSL